MAYMMHEGVLPFLPPLLNQQQARLANEWFSSLVGVRRDVFTPPSHEQLSLDLEAYVADITKSGALEGLIAEESKG